MHNDPDLELIVEMFHDELEKIAAAGRLPAALLRLLRQPKAAKYVEEKGKNLSNAMKKILDYHPPQPSFLKKRHLLGPEKRQMVRDAVADNPEALPLAVMSPIPGSISLGIPAYAKLKNFLAAKVEDKLTKREAKEITNTMLKRFRHHTHRKPRPRKA